jgi:hypothetical protein
VISGPAKMTKISGCPKMKDEGLTGSVLFGVYISIFGAYFEYILN